MTKPTVCLVDDDADLRNAMRLLLKAEGINLVSFATAKEFLADLDNKETPKVYNCLIVDVRLPGMTGTELVSYLNEKKVAIPVILLTGHATVAMAVQAMKSGAVDVIEKPFNDDELVKSVRQGIAMHEKWKRLLDERQIAAKRIAKLTPRETEVLGLMITGLQNRKIAEELGISPKTLDIHRSNVMDKIEARTTADLVRAYLLDKSDPLALPHLAL
jgi:two-component system response regulator FixJ